jgi:hypothetical protein
MVPWAFRRRSAALRWLRTGALGLCLATVTTAAFGGLLQVPPLPVAASTLLTGCIWAALVGNPKAGSRAMGWRWAASLPLAMANAALAGALFLACSVPRSGSDPVELFVGAVLAGFWVALQGVDLWLPALVLTLVFLGVPIHVARSFSMRGLDGEDFGDAVVGSVCATGGVAAMAMWAALDPSLAHNPHRPWDLSAGDAWAMRVAPVLAVLAGGAVAALAGVRFAQRRALLRAVEGGGRSDYRVVQMPEGRRLARVHAASPAYRQADQTEPICELDEAGGCRQSLLGD